MCWKKLCWHSLFLSLFLSFFLPSLPLSLCPAHPPLFLLSCFSINRCGSKALILMLKTAGGECFRPISAWRFWALSLFHVDIISWTVRDIRTQLQILTSTFRHIQALRGTCSRRDGYLSSYCSQLGTSHSQKALESYSADHMKMSKDCIDYSTACMMIPSAV